MAHQQHTEGEPEVKVLTEKQIADYKEAFHIFDKDDDGYITADEVIGLMHNLNFKHVKLEHVQNWIREKDADGNGTLDFEEFLQMMTGERKDHDNEEGDYRGAFKVFDRNGDGFITKEELRQTMKDLGDTLTWDEVKAMIADADIDHDGKIDYEEFVHMMKKNKF